MQSSAFKIFNASAGSGKTFTIAKSYIKILVQSKNPEQFKNILAITFTNKAVGEMKERIITMLKSFSNEKSLTQPHPMFSAICEELSISPETLHIRSKHILKHIMHNYGAFDISTIDGFTHRVIRTFAHDLELPVNFEVELEQENLLNEAVDSLISKAGSDKTLTNILIDFAIEKADDDRSWDISYDFKKIAKLLISENDLHAIVTLKQKSIDDFKALKTQLVKTISKLEIDLVTIANSALTLIEEAGLEYDDFNRKSLPNYFKNLAQKNFNARFDAAWQNDLIEGQTIYPKRVTDNIASTIESIQPQLAEAFLQTKNKIFDFKLHKGFLRNITPLSVINAIQTELDQLKEEQNKMLISEFNKIVSNEIKDQPTPFIYERLGEKYRHYFIDEFQDTSQMQWENLVPLLDNALSTSHGSAMLVGDAKQAIYRWRGGVAEQFINLYNKTTNPFQVDPEILALGTNFRSAKEIINFNNGFFQFLSENYFTNEDYSNLYKASFQNANNDRDGYVNFDFLNIARDDDDDEIYSHKVLETINLCYDKGYVPQDICIIVRKRKQGVAIANYLSEKGLKITSSETLLLKNSDKVVFLDNILKLLLQPNNDSLKINILTFLADQYKVEDKHLFFETHLKPSVDDMFQSLESLNIFINKANLLHLPLYDLVEELIRSFNLENTSDAFLEFYLDLVLEFTQKQHSDLSAFTNYFEKEKDRLSVVSPKDIDAIQIMTIHKCKGLEFPVVIFPFADLNIYKELEPKVWFPVEQNDYNGFENLLLNYNKDIEHFGEAGLQIYNTHQSQLELDNINLLYVTLTRAVECLFVISKYDLDSKGKVNALTFSGMFISYLQSLGIWTEQQLTYSFGTFEPPLVEEKSMVNSKSLQLISVPKEYHNLKIVTKAGQLWDTKQEKAIERGNLVHLILSKIKTINDLDFAVSELLETGDIIKEEVTELRALVESVIEHPILSSYYSDNYEIYNERDIVMQSGELLRPDRVNVNSNNEVIIIDYKTGEQKTNHQNQIRSYASVLEDMKFKIKHKYLVYINDAIEVVEV
ncbi:UvrD-helicase domain-containing protein [Winogradskyella tangerina]|uniref:UvrD-helicase domain-containing protein n=1 Tax=Winogradskyella tangerina TaxID=2023240 RepID=UPI000DBE9327|nr:UvrD-helicase domain-containing protein [Winogradskyella tangerina]